MTLLVPCNAGIEYLSIVLAAASGRGLWGKQRFENFPLLIGEFGIAHSSTLFTYSSFYAFLDYFMSIQQTMTEKIKAGEVTREQWEAMVAAEIRAGVDPSTLPPFEELKELQRIS